MSEEREQLGALLKASEELRDDLLMRADKDDDGTIVVNASHGRWTRFCAAIRAARDAL